MANLTFSVNLTESEKAAREKVVLPYMHHLNQNRNFILIWLKIILILLTLFLSFRTKTWWRSYLLRQ